MRFIFFYLMLFVPFTACAADTNLKMSDFCGQWQYLRNPKITMTVQPDKIVWSPSANGEAMYKVLKSFPDSVYVAQKESAPIYDKPRYSYVRYSFFKGYAGDQLLSSDSCWIPSARPEDEYGKSAEELWQMMMKDDSGCLVDEKTGKMIGKGWSSAGGYSRIND